MINSDNFTKRTIIHSGVLYSGSIIINRLAAAFNLFIIVYFLTLYEYGVFKLILSLVGIFQSFVLTGLDGVIRNDIAIELKNKNEDNAAQIFFEYFFLKLILVILVWVALYIFIVFFAGSYYDQNFVNILKVASFTIILNYFSDTFALYFKGIGALALLSKINPFLEIIKISILLIVFSVFGASIQSLIWSIIYTQVVTYIVYFYFTYKSIMDWWGRFQWKFPKSIYLTASMYGKWSILSNILSDFLSNFRTYIIKLLLSTEAVAIYSVARSMIDSLNQIFTSNKVLMVFLPYKISKDDLKSEYYRLGIKYATFLYTTLAVVGFFAGTVIINLFFIKYISSLQLFYIMLPSFLLFGVSDFINSYLYVLRQQKVLFFRALLKNVSVVFLTFILVPIFGINGLGVEYFITNLVLTLSLYMYFKKKYPVLTIKPRDFIVSKYEFFNVISKLRSLVTKG